MLDTLRDLRPCKHTPRIDAPELSEPLSPVRIGDQIRERATEGLSATRDAHHPSEIRQR